MNEGLFTAYRNLPEWNKLLTCLRPGDCTAVAEIAEGERAFLAAALAHHTGRPVLLAAASELTAQKQAQDVERLLGSGSAVLPGRDVQFSRAAMSRESTWNRLSVLDNLVQGRVKVLCVSVEALLDRCAPADRFRNAVITLSEGDRFAPEKLIQRLMENGYERVPIVEGQGQCAMRGAILDIFPANARDAVRIEFFDDEVDSLRRFDCISQRSIARIKGIRIAPATECLIEDADAAADRLKAALHKGSGSRESARDEKLPEGLLSQEEFLSELDKLELTEDILRQTKPAPSEEDQNWKRHLDDVDRVRAGQCIRTATMWMNVLCERTAFVTDYLKDPIVLLDRADQFPGRLRSADASFAEAYEDARLRGDAFEDQLSLRFTYDDLLERLRTLPCITLCDLVATFARLDPRDVITFGSTPSTAYQSQWNVLSQDVEKWKKEGYSVVLLTGGEARGQRLQKTLEENGQPSVYAESLDGNLIEREAVLLPVAYSKGFVHPAAKLAVISDTDIYGTAYQRAKKKHKAGERIASFTDLKSGDYVVHDLHGVGIFQGVVQLESDGTRRDYLLILYAGNDKLYVPADQFDRVTKFIGAEQSLPKLNRLGGQDWERQKSKVKASVKKLAFDLVELYAKRAKSAGYAFSHENPWQQEFEELFPYELTEDQQKSVAEIEGDMESPHNMDRLLCGDVGYGKTEVALRAAFKALVDGKQVAILAPTTILVQQHYNTIRKRFAGFPVRFDMLSRFRSPKEQREVVRKLKDGELDFVVGTHRLLNKDVQFKDLGLLIVDEEQRFGVNHKESIQHMKTRVDVLTLTATPIPRTLHMSMVGIRDMSVLETPPEERLPVKTYVMEYSDGVIREAIRREMARGGQVYFLYNRVRSIASMYDRIHALVPDARIGIAHGQMAENALEDVMLDFYAGAYDVLLCTTIVESGLDVPDANTLIVFDADHFGLAQLYQIRGRVGRSSRQAYAYFTVRAGRELTETANQRLSAIREFTEFGAGFRIAMRDLEIRGAGDVLGPQQSGHLSAVGYDMYVKLIEEAVSEAQGVEVTPELDTRIELRINAYLPQDYVPQEKLRVEIYKRIAMIEDENGRMDIAEELIDRFGDVPAPVENLMRIAHLRGVTRKLGISHLCLRGDGVHMRLDEKHLPDPALLFEAVTLADPRLRFAAGKVPEVVLGQPKLNAEAALELSVDVMTKVHVQLTRLRRERAPETVSEGETV